MLEAFLPIGSAFLVSILLTWYLSRPDTVLNILDYPNERSLHKEPVPRTGGLAIILAILIGMGLAISFGDLVINIDLTWLVLGMLVVSLISFLDDRYGLTIAIRFLVHIIAACLILVGGWAIKALSLPFITIDLPYPVMVVFTVVFVVWLINLYNFMDGMDGFAAGMALFGFSILGLAGYAQGEMFFAITNWVIASSAAGFLVFNFPPAKIFMGDIGSSTLGYLVAAMLLWADQAEVISLWLGVLLFSPFIVDATVTLLRRIINGEKFWHAHKTHYYQRLVVLGWGHKRTVLVEYGLMLLLGLTVLVIMNESHKFAGFLALSIWGILYILMAFVVQHMELKKKI